jgi:hypothetical protein
MIDELIGEQPDGNNQVFKLLKDAYGNFPIQVSFLFFDTCISWRVDRIESRWTGSTREGTFPTLTATDDSFLGWSELLFLNYDILQSVNDSKPRWTNLMVEVTLPKLTETAIPPSTHPHRLHPPLQTSKLPWLRILALLLPMLICILPRAPLVVQL